jgi:hypothetical protein
LGRNLFNINLTPRIIGPGVRRRARSAPTAVSLVEWGSTPWLRLVLPVESVLFAPVRTAARHLPWRRSLCVSSSSNISADSIHPRKCLNPLPADLTQSTTTFTRTPNIRTSCTPHTAQDS